MNLFRPNYLSRTLENVKICPSRSDRNTLCYVLDPGSHDEFLILTSDVQCNCSYGYQGLNVIYTTLQKLFLHPSSRTPLTSQKSQPLKLTPDLFTQIVLETEVATRLIAQEASL